jgi:hypothetical protein
MPKSKRHSGLKKMSSSRAMAKTNNIFQRGNLNKKKPRRFLLKRKKLVKKFFSTAIPEMPGHTGPPEIVVLYFFC